MKPEYHEGYGANEETDPLSSQPGITEFDHDSIQLCKCSKCVAEALTLEAEGRGISADELEYELILEGLARCGAIEGEDSQSATKREQLTIVSRRVVEWITDIPEKTRKLDKTIAQRFLAAAWVLHPDFFEGESLTHLISRTNMTKMMFSRITAEFSKAFGVKNQGQSHGTKD